MNVSSANLSNARPGSLVHRVVRSRGAGMVLAAVLAAGAGGLGAVAAAQVGAEIGRTSAPRTDLAKGAEVVKSASGVTLEHAAGFALDYPKAWQVRDFNGYKALVPDDAKQLLGDAAEVYALAAMPWTGSGSGDDRSAIVDRLVKEVTGTFPLLSLDGGASEIVSGEASGLLMRFKGPKLGELEAGANVRAGVRGGLLVVMIGIGERSALAGRDAAANEVFLTSRRTASKVDGSIVGAWRNSDSYSSQGFSAATSRTCVLRADGTYSYTTRVAGGTSDVSMDSGGDTATGTWTADGSVATLTSGSGDVTTMRYKLVDGSLVVYSPNGSRRIWGR